MNNHGLTIQVYHEGDQSQEVNGVWDVEYKNDLNPTISSAWFYQVSENIVVVCVDLNKKYCQPNAMMGKGLWIGRDFLVVKGLDHWENYNTFASPTSRYTCWFTLVKEPENVMDRKVDYQDDDGRLPFTEYYKEEA